MRAYTFARLACDIAEDDLRRGYVPCVLKELFYQLRTAFSDAHRAERAITGVAVRPEDHVAACSQLFSCI